MEQNQMRQIQIISIRGVGHVNNLLDKSVFFIDNLVLMFTVTRTKKTRWDIGASPAAVNTHNPIRRIVDSLCVEPNPEKQVIALSIGDPTILGNLTPAPEIIDAVRNSLECLRYNGYSPSTGYMEAREAVAKYSSFQNCDVKADDVIICSGCSHALDLCITALASPGQNVLVPRPGFSIYKTLADTTGIQVKYYNLLEDQQWKVDTVDLENKIDERTTAIVIINPSNPCGSVYSSEHLKEILAVAERNFLPIIADEIYEHLVFPGYKFVPIASLSKNVPILSCSGTTKRFLVPGWRMGWIIIHDRHNALNASVKNGLINLSQRIIGSNTLVQGALPEILTNTPKSFFQDVCTLIFNHAKIAYDLLKHVRGLKPIMPAGAMYMMVGIDIDLFPRIKDDLEFVEKLMCEQSVFCLPGKCFNYPNFFRIVLTVTDTMLKEACNRIGQFCDDHVLIENHMKNLKMSIINCEDINVIG